MDIVMLGVDLGKNVYSVAGLDPSGRVVLRRRMKKETFIEFARQWPRRCGGSPSGHYSGHRRVERNRPGGGDR